MKKAFLLVFIVATIFSLVGCSAVSYFAPTVTLTDDFGRQIKVPNHPKRIISMAPNITEFLFALGLNDKIVGVTDMCDYPPAAINTPKIGGYFSPPIENIISLKPDLVVADALNKTVVEQLDALNIPVLVLNPSTIAQVMSNALLLGKATGTTKAAEKIVKDIQSALTEVESKLLPISFRPTVYYEVWFPPIMTAGPSTFLHDLITKAGGHNMAYDSPSNYPVFSLEVLMVRNPQVIIYGHTRTETTADIAGRDGWQSISAVTTGRIYKLDENLLLRSGPRVGEALLLLAKTIHPTLWK
ncbi:MAG: cobalamin-binding protein [bacterium]|nr:cobalamin-binding protein [bacterium]